MPMTNFVNALAGFKYLREGFPKINNTPMRRNSISETPWVPAWYFLRCSFRDARM